MGMDLFCSSVAVASVLVIFLVLKLFYRVWVIPMRVAKYMKQQGVDGPPYKLFVGNFMENISMTLKARSKPMELSHAIAPRLLCFEDIQVKKYGKLFLSWHGLTPRLNTMDPDMVKDVLNNKFGHFAKQKENVIELLVTGLVSHDGEKWAKHRRIINPAFHQEKLKMMLPAFYACCSEFVDNLEKLVPKESCEVDIWPYLQNLTADVISRAAFGSSYEEGQRIFTLQAEMAEYVLKDVQSLRIPGSRFLPTKRNNRKKEIYQEVRSILRKMIERREKAMKSGVAKYDDLLGILMESNFKEIEEGENNKKLGMSIDDVIEECKLFYFAGQETTVTLLVWTMIALSMHPEWQEKAREEVSQVFGSRKPDFDCLSRLKIVTMILNETLRLYPPLVFLSRYTYKPMKLGDVSVPADVEIAMPVLLIHHDRDIWGHDADEFNPERFSEGVLKATKGKVAFFPFSWGPRICIGQNFALLESKLALAMILQKFSWELSPTYSHAPTGIVTVQPEHGAPLILHRL